MHWAFYGCNGHIYPQFPSERNISTTAEVLGGFLFIDRHTVTQDGGPLPTVD